MQTEVTEHKIFSEKVIILHESYFIIKINALNQLR